MQIIKSFFSDDSGSNALEYGLLVALISLPIVVGAGQAGTAVENIFLKLGTILTTQASNISV